MNVFFNGFNTQEVTFEAENPVITKRAVALQSSGKVSYAEVEGPFTGIASSYRNGLVSVVMHGYAVVSYTGTNPTRGIHKLSVAPSGMLKLDDTNGVPFNIVGVDTTAKTIEIIL